MPHALQMRLVPVEQLTMDPQNVRLHGEANLKAIEGSLTEFGQVEPLVVQKSSGRIIGGNGRVEALRKLGVKEVYVVEIDVDDTRAAALGIALNRTGELATWDYEGLAKLLEDLQSKAFDLTITGWEKTELANLLSADWAAPELKDLTDVNGEKATEGVAGGGVPVVQLTAEQRKAFEKACNRARVKAKNKGLSEGACLELISRAFLE